MGGHGYETKVTGNLTVAQAKRMFPGINPKSIVRWTLIGGAYVVSYKEIVNGVTIIRTKTIFEKAKEKKNKKRK